MDCQAIVALLAGACSTLAGACAMLWRENRRLGQQVLDEAHTTTEVVQKDAETWQTALPLMREIRDELRRKKGG